MADIVLKDRSGNPVEYPGVERIKVNTVDGEAVEFVDSATIPEVIENLPIGLDFSGGNQTITAPDGLVVKSAIIQQPDTLIPANIAEGVDIAGIIGTLAAGGSAKFATGTITNEQTSPVIVEHGLGVTPDIVFYYIASKGTSSRHFGIGVSTAFGNLIGTVFNDCLKTSNTGALSNVFRTEGIDHISDSVNFNVAVYGANENSFTINSSSGYKIQAGTIWVAIGGLT